MDLYDQVAYENSRHLTLRYSTSFGISSRFFSKSIKDHIYAIYALVRIADEIVDTYAGIHGPKLLNELEERIYETLQTGYDTNLVIHAFCKTATVYGIDRTLIKPFFDSMRMDLTPQLYKSVNYTKYIHGSAEVIGLMCLRVFLDGNSISYNELMPGATALGSAYQKVNFLRDLSTDYKELGRIYFPQVTYDTFNEKQKQIIILDIKNDFSKAILAINKLPNSSKRATLISYVYYSELLKKLERTSAETIKHNRVRITSIRKLILMIKTVLFGVFKK
ncbi:MAG: squalene/phytoene synthase family protein [Candidatus Saccharimonadales bacterium]